MLRRLRCHGDEQPDRTEGAADEHREETGADPRQGAEAEGAGLEHDGETEEEDQAARAVTAGDGRGGVHVHARGFKW